MSREKQIEEMTRIVCIQMRDYPKLTCKKCKADNRSTNAYCRIQFEMERLYNAGYRKSTDVAREMIENLANDLWEGELDTLNISVGKRFYNKQEFIAELKKKYTVTDTTVGSKTEEGK